MLIYILGVQKIIKFIDSEVVEENYLRASAAKDAIR